MAGALVVVRTGTANLASVVAALRRCGADPVVATSPEQLSNAARLVLPGVGAFGAAMRELRAHGLSEPIAAHVRAHRPLLAICLGLQLLCEQSEESPEVDGLGVLPGRVCRFPAGPRIPQLGWNRVEAEPGCRLLQSGHAYYANSYCLPASPPGWSTAASEHGVRFVAAVERGAMLACQFHPELSGGWGRALLQRWLSVASEGGSAAC